MAVVEATDAPPTYSDERLHHRNLMLRFGMDTASRLSGASHLSVVCWNW